MTNHTYEYLKATDYELDGNMVFFYITTEYTNHTVPAHDKKLVWQDMKKILKFLKSKTANP